MSDFHSINMKASFFSGTLLGLTCLGIATSMTFAQAPARKNFGKGAPFRMEELPDGKLKSKLETLNPEDRAKAMKWLHTINFQDFDAAEHLRQVLESGEWQRPEFNTKHAVT